MLPDQDGRRHKKQHLASLTYRASILETLLLAIRAGTEADVQELMDSIKREATYPQIFSAAERILKATLTSDPTASRITIAALTDRKALPSGDMNGSSAQLS